jgi:histidine triad (HIT) family protein
MAACVICQLVDRELPLWRVFEDEHTLCFLPLGVEAFGHTVIAPKAHYADIYSTPPQVIATVLPTVQRVAIHYREAIGATGVNLLHASGGAAQQSVAHLHFHLIPRIDGDGLDTWPQLPEVEIDRDALLQLLRF